MICVFKDFEEQLGHVCVNTCDKRLKRVAGSHAQACKPRQCNRSRSTNRRISWSNCLLIDLFEPNSTNQKSIVATKLIKTSQDLIEKF